MILHALVAMVALAAPMTPTDLRCEYLLSPQGIDVAQPRLSWKLESPQRGQKQTAYRVLVASTREKLDADQGDVWDSGKVDSEQSIHVPYAGAALASFAGYWWKAQAWDKDGNPSGWSEPASWTMGVLRPEEWQGKWIMRMPAGASKEFDMTPTDKDAHRTEPTWNEPAPLFRKGFEVTKPVSKAMLYVCGLGFNEVRLNGEKVGDRVLEPSLTRYDKRALYSTYDVSQQIAQGKNALGIELGNGWYNMHARAAWDFYKAPWRARPQALALLRVEHPDGSVDTIVSDESWKTAGGPVTFDCIRNGVSYDARLEKPGWDKADFDDSKWESVQITDAPKGILTSEVLPAKIMKTIKPVRLTEPAPGVFLFDMGQNMAGWSQLHVSGPAGTTITLRYDERLDDKGMLSQENKIYLFSGDFQTDRYTLKGEGVETFEPRFAYHGFQYVQIEGFPGKPTLDSIQGEVIHTAFQPAGSFECSNELLNKIQRNTKWSYIGNFVDGYPTDCPHREKNGWTGDAQLAIDQALMNFASAPAYAKWMNDFKDSQPESGELTGIIPTSGWGKDIGPSWDSAYIIIPWAMYLYCGDTRVLADQYDGMRKQVDYIGTRAKDYIADYGLGDWVPSKTKTNADITSTAYYYYDALTVSKAAALLGKTDDAKKYGDLAKAIYDAFNAKFYKADEGTYGQGTQTSLATALYQGLVPAERQATITDKLVDMVRGEDNHFDGGILGAKYLLNVLTDQGHADVAYDVASSKTFPSWGSWIEQGATTLWENWDGSLSRNHIMFGDISAWFYKTLAGINYDESKPGFKHVVIRPHLVGDLSYAKAEHESMYGTIRSAWKKQDGGLALEVSVPVNTTATVYVPATGLDAVTEGGAQATQAEGISNPRMEGTYAVFDLGSGDYKFAAK
jgi:alpha-L-rhamnosidase